MEKFSFYDFMAFIVPGGTFILLAAWLIYANIPQGCNIVVPDSIFLIIPFLFISFIVGHTLSSFGIFIENTLFRKHSFVTKYFIENPQDAQKLNDLSKKLFEIDLLPNNVLEPKLVDKFYQKVYDYIEINKANDKTAILFGQYAFFRNAAALSLFISILSIVLFILIKIKLIVLNGEPFLYALTSIGTLLLSFICLVYLSKRLSILISCSYRNFLSMFINPKIQ